MSIWFPARTLARKVTRQLLGNQRGQAWAEVPRWEAGPRILDDRHFIFRGGADLRKLEARTRAGDQDAGPHAPAPEDSAR